MTLHWREAGQSIPCFDELGKSFSTGQRSLSGRKVALSIALDLTRLLREAIIPVSMVDGAFWNVPSTPSRVPLESSIFLLG